MIRQITLFSILFCTLLVISQRGWAQQNPDAFFRPVKSNNLITKLPPRLDKRKLLGADFDENFLSFDGNGGCPEEILIGSVQDEADISGDVDIEVFIDGGVFIECGL